MSSASGRSLWRVGAGLSIDCSRPRVLAVLNATEDSFYSGSRVRPGGEMEERIGRLAEAGADIIDIGGQSTRPGSPRVGAAEELTRVLPVLEALRRLLPHVPVSIDTYHSWVAREALSAGAVIVNDISAGALDSALIETVAGSDCGYVLMHMQGSPDSMQHSPQYGDCTGEVAGFLSAKLAELVSAGIAPERVVLDPGIGFGKRVEDNLALIRAANAVLAEAGRPLLFGISRKSFIGRLAPQGDPAYDDAAFRLPGTLGLTWELLARGVMLHRVHDVAEVRQVFALWEAVQGMSAAG